MGGTLVTSVGVLVVSGALFFFYIQAFCEKVLRQEFSHSYLQDVIEAVKLEYPLLRDSCAFSGPFSYSDARLSLQCDFITLEYLLKRGGPSRQNLHRRERIMMLYFRCLLFSLSVRHAFRLKEKEAVLKLSAILQFFANSVGEKLSINSFTLAQAGLESQGPPAC